MELVTDFCADLTEWARAQLEMAGFPMPRAATADEVELRHATLQRWLPEPKPRRVHLARELHCPGGHDDGLDALVAKLKSGTRMWAHMSRRIGRPAAHDLMLNDWGILHFHLGTSPEQDGFVARTGPLLFAMLLDDDAYLLGIENHGGGTQSPWTNRELLHRMFRHWPKAMDRFELDELDPGPELSDTQFRNLRKAHCNAVVRFDGRAYAPPGGGFSASGVAIQAVYQSDYRRWLVRREEQMAHAEPQRFLEVASSVYLKPPDQLRLRLDPRPTGLWARTEDGRCSFSLCSWGGKRVHVNSVCTITKAGT